MLNPGMKNSKSAKTLFVEQECIQLLETRLEVLESEARCRLAVRAGTPVLTPDRICSVQVQVALVTAALES